MTNETLDTQVSALNNEPDDSLLPLDVIYNLFGFLPNKDLARHRLVSNKWQKYVKKALAYYAKGMFDPKYIDTAFLSKLQVPLELAKTFIEYRYKDLQSGNDIQLDRYFEGNAAAITPIAQEAVTVETLIKALHDLEQKQQKINSKQKVEIEYTINSLEGLVNYIKAYDQLQNKHYLLKIDFNQNESPRNNDFINLLLDIIKLSNDQNPPEPINISYNNEVIQVTYDQAKHIANHITVLELARCGIKAEGAKTIAGYLKTNTSLTSLDLRTNGIDAAGAKDLADALNTNKALRYLNLHWNNIGAEGATAIAAIILKANTTLTSLNLNWNAIGDVGAQAIADALQANTTLAFLELGHNSIGAAGATAIAITLKTNTTLSSLNLERSKIGDVGAQDLADALKINKALRFLNLNLNDIGDVGAKAIADALTINTTLTSLHLGVNNMGAAGASALGKAIAYVKMTQNRDITIMLDYYLEQSFNAAREEELARLEQPEEQEKLKSLKSRFVDRVARQDKNAQLVKHIH
ncbi:F-box protein [Rickettsiales endosymbiont of Stachyamoeba lipophora]|uniref:F-box protein n=1 Tax=Rickettsiales endosymbiont of Stachyamoeba lipophora TaxID=2486578 RepID=UPI000F64FA60|nr:F-box protein [Rickettsiales endosymbiont of Stachyamoeba lipophora]AZL16083.1 hypothetical protein EF513_05990 [Rickettsiales endosymbiont of Stachyamoeba lipophora]